MHIMHYYDRPNLQAFIDKFNFLAPKLARIATFFICSIDSNGQGGLIKHKKKKFVESVLLLQTETLQNYGPAYDVIFGRFGLQ